MYIKYEFSIILNTSESMAKVKIFVMDKWM